MATDATGTVTPNYSIPRYNTAVDAPSGNGFNAAMLHIDTTLDTIEDTLEAAIDGKASLALVIALGG